MSFDFHYPTPLPSTKGWGPGWPNCQDKARQGISTTFFPGVHRDIAELVGLIVNHLHANGYRFMDPGCWGFGCRATKDVAGTQDDVPSFHSWGLALDFNAPENVFGSDASRSKIATEDRWIVPILKRYGFFWLGPDIKDWMHFHFCGSPEDAVDMTQLAREELGEMGVSEDIIAGSAAGRAADLDDDPPPNKSDIWKWAFNEAQRIKKAATLPRPGTGTDPGAVHFGESVIVVKP